MAALAGCTGPLPGPTAEITESVATTVAVTSPPPVENTPEPSPTATLTPAPVNHIQVDPSQVQGAILRFWHPWVGQEGEAVRSLVETFNLTNEWNIVIVASSMGSLDGVQTQMDQVLAGESDVPDLVVAFPYQALTWEPQLPLANWQPFIDDDQWGLSPEAIADFYPVFWQHDQAGGRQVGIPALRSAQVLYYNRTWARELELFTPPVSLQQLADQACASAEALRSDATVENDSLGGWIVSANDAALLSMIYTFGGTILNPSAGDGESPYRFHTPASEGAFTFLRELYDGRCAWWPDSAGAEAAFAERGGLFATGSVMGIPYQAAQFRQRNRGDEWTVIPYPTPDLPSAATSIDVYGPSFFLLPTTVERQVAAWLFVRWLLQSEQHAHLVEASASFPLRQGELPLLADFMQQYPAYTAALALLPSARGEPADVSWMPARLALGDAGAQLFRSYFSKDQIPTMLDFLDRTVAELLVGPEASGVFHTPTPTFTPSPTFTRTPWPTAAP